MSTDQLNVYTLAQVFHRLAEDRIVHELVEILFKVAGSLLAKLCVHLDIGLHSGALVEPQSSVNLLPGRDRPEGCGSTAHTWFVEEVWHQLYYFNRHLPKFLLVFRHPLLLNYHAFWCQQIGIVLVVQLLRLF